MRFLLATCTALGLLVALPACAADTGITGTVLWGPTKPGPEKLGEDNEAPLRASFTVMSADEPIATFESDRTGNFKVSLPPGDYTLVPDKGTPIPNATKQTTRVTVPDDGYVTVTIRLDTGMM